VLDGLQCVVGLGAKPLHAAPTVVTDAFVRVWLVFPKLHKSGVNLAQQSFCFLESAAELQQTSSQRKTRVFGPWVGWNLTECSGASSRSHRGSRFVLQKESMAARLVLLGVEHLARLEKRSPHPGHRQGPLKSRCRGTREAALSPAANGAGTLWKGSGALHSVGELAATNGSTRNGCDMTLQHSCSAMSGSRATNSGLSTMMRKLA
jgi:hypothetical protein